MDYVRNLFGMNTEYRPPPRKRADPTEKPHMERIGELIDTHEMNLAIKQDELEEVKEELKHAIDTRDRSAAGVKLQRKKQLERELQILQGKIGNLRQQMSVTGNAQANLEHARLAREGADELQSLAQEAEALNLQEAMDDLRNGMEDVNVFDTVLSDPLTTQDQMVQLELDDELDALFEMPMPDAPGTNVAEDQQIKTTELKKGLK